MKNRIITMIICCICICGIVACGSSTDASSTEQQKTNEIVQTQESENVATDENIIVFDSPYTVIDDENVMVQIESVEKIVNNEGADYEFINYNVNLIIHNRNEVYDINCSVANGASYIGGYTVDFANGDTKTKAGKNNDAAYYSCTIHTNQPEVSNKGWEHIESLEDLLTFEATVNVSLYEDTGKEHKIYDRYNVDISLPDVME